MSKVLVFSQAQEGALSKGSKEILNAGKQLASALSADVEAVIIGSEVAAAADELARTSARQRAVPAHPDPLRSSGPRP